MTVDQIRLIVSEAVKDGYLFEQEGTMLSTAEGYNRAALAALGAMIMNLGRPTFNVYCENQRRLLGWLASKGNPIAAQVREIRTKHRDNEPTTRSMFQDVAKEFVQPLAAEHVARGGKPLSVDQEESTCAMLLAKVLWDFNLGNSDLARLLRMVGPTLGR